MKGIARINNLQNLEENHDVSSFQNDITHIIQCTYFLTAFVFVL